MNKCYILDIHIAKQIDNPYRSLIGGEVTYSHIEIGRRCYMEITTPSGEHKNIVTSPVTETVLHDNVMTIYTDDFIYFLIKGKVDK